MGVCGIISRVVNAVRGGCGSTGIEFDQTLSLLRESLACARLTSAQVLHR